MKKKITWVASYPKSGNTWIRSILASLIYNNNNFEFEMLKNITEFENPFYYDFVKAISKKDFINLKDINILSGYWLKAQENFIQKNQSLFFKSHASNISFLNNPYTSKEMTKGVIYVLRDPRDLVISYAKHLNKNIDEVIEIIRTTNTLAYSSSGKYPILLSRWDYHVLSWLKLDVPKIIIQYEHLLTNTYGVVSQIINFMKKELQIDLDISESKIKKILENTSFKKLKQKELKEGFPEASKYSNFFRSGKRDQWKEILNKNQKELIEREFNFVMKKFNYI